jgi:hypothetical protein
MIGYFAFAPFSLIFWERARLALPLCSCHRKKEKMQRRVSRLFILLGIMALLGFQVLMLFSPSVNRGKVIYDRNWYIRGTADHNATHDPERPTWSPQSEARQPPNMASKATWFGQTFWALAPGWMATAAISAFVLGVVYALVRPKLFHAYRVERHFIWLRDVHPAILAEFPELEE